MSLIIRYFIPIVLLSIVASARSAETRDADDYFFNLNTGDFKAESIDAKASGKKAILVMFEQDGCPGCFYMRNNVLNRVDVQDFYRKNFVNFTINIFGAVPITDFSGRDFTEKSFSRTADVRGTPTFVFYDLNGAEAVRILGPIREVSDFMLLGKFVASGAYKKRKFAEYLQLHRKNQGS